MKIFTTIFLTISIFLQTFSTFIIQADFMLNRSYITRNLCVNRDKPMMNCKGKCYLSKKLKAQEKQDQQAPVSNSENFNIVPFFVPTPYKIETTVSNLKMEFFIKDDGTLSSFPNAIFHPPSA